MWGRTILLKSPSIRAGWYIGESIGFTNIRSPYRLFRARFRGRVSSPDSEHIWPPIQPRSVMYWFETVVYELKQDYVKLNQTQLVVWSELWNVSLKILMQRASEKLPIIHVGARSAALLKTVWNLWAPTAMCTATQQKWKTVKPKCPNIFIHTMCVLYQYTVYIVNKSTLFLHHPFWITLYLYSGSQEYHMI